MIQLNDILISTNISLDMNFTIVLFEIRFSLYDFNPISHLIQ